MAKTKMKVETLTDFNVCFLCVELVCFNFRSMK